MKSDKKQTMILIAVALLAAAGVLLYVALSQPKIYEPVNAVADASAVPAQSEAIVAENAVTAAAPATSAKAQTGTTVVAVSYPINLNTATLEELMTIDGLGEARASAILEYRDAIGKYTDVSQIMNIKGISDAIYAEVAGYLTV